MSLNKMEYRKKKEGGRRRNHYLLPRIGSAIHEKFSLITSPSLFQSKTKLWSPWLQHFYLSLSLSMYLSLLWSRKEKIKLKWIEKKRKKEFVLKYLFHPGKLHRHRIKDIYIPRDTEITNPYFIDFPSSFFFSTHFNRIFHFNEYSA